MGRFGKWLSLVKISFNTESILLNAFMNEMENDKYSNLTDYLNVIMIKICGDEFDGIEELRKQHPDYFRD